MLLPLLHCYLCCCLLLWSLSLAAASLVFVWSLVSLVLRFFYDVGAVATGVATGVAATGAATGIATAGIAGAVATGVAIGVVATAVVATAVVTGIVAGVVTTGVAAASLVFLGLLTLLYARSLLYLW